MHSLVNEIKNKDHLYSLNIKMKYSFITIELPFASRFMKRFPSITVWLVEPLPRLLRAALDDGPSAFDLIVKSKLVFQRIEGDQVSRFGNKNNDIM